MKIFLDMDGVVADFVAGAETFFNKEFTGTDRDIVKHFGMTDDEFWPHLDFAFWSSLPKTDEADEIVQACLAHTSYVCFLSQPCKTIGSGEGKRAWAEAHYPDIPVLLSYDSKYYCAAPDHVLIDDYVLNCHRFESCGGVTVVVPRPWNSCSLFHGENVIKSVRRQLQDCVRRMGAVQCV